MCSLCCPARDHSPPVCAQGRRRRLKHLQGRNAVEDLASSAGLLRRRRRRHRRTSFRRGVSARATGAAGPCSWRRRPKRERDRLGDGDRLGCTDVCDGGGHGKCAVAAAREAERTSRQPSTSCRGTSVGARLPIGRLDTRNVYVSPSRRGGLRARDRNPHGPRRGIVRSLSPARRGSVARRHFAEVFFRLGAPRDRARSVAELRLGDGGAQTLCRLEKFTSGRESPLS